MYITYITLCKVTGCYYIGSHKMSGELDEYFGSGKRLKESLKLYGEANHIREIVGKFDSRAEAIELEHALIKEHRKDPLLLNANNGGYSFDYINESGKNVYPISHSNLEIRKKNLNKGRETTRMRLLMDDAYRESYRKNRSEATALRNQLFGNPFLGKHHSEATKKVLSEKAKAHSVGESNSQYGTYWITNDTSNKKWKDSYGNIPDGFRRGRVMKSK